MSEFIYTLKLTLAEAELLDIALGLAAKHAPSCSPEYKKLLDKVLKQFEDQE